MRGAAMSLTAAASGLVVFLLSVSVVQGQDVWRVTYSSTEICAVKGSTVEINCSFTYPSRWDDGENRVEKTFWFTKQKGGEPEDLTTVSEYAGRVEDLCENNICTLRIRNLSESDSAQYKFRFKTNQAEYSGNPVTLSVTDSPKLPSVSVSPSAEIEEGRSVTLTCSSDANPAAKYTWYKRNGNANVPLISKDSRLVFRSIQSSDSGQYYCRAEDSLGTSTSATTFIDVKYPPKLPSVSVSPSAEIEEGSSVTLTCSSDANPAANYTWYKEDEDSPKASGQIFTITDFRAEHSGSYSCGAQNKLGHSNSTLTECWNRRKRASRDSSEPEERADTREECVPDQPEQQDDLQYASVHFSNNRADPLYSNMRAAEPLRHTEQQEVSEYAAVKFSSAAPRTRGQDPGEDPAALYSTVNKSR
ncbi:hypothetical protein NQZ68_013473 [Dissostichus eleginoides]|nr:hypothetical protein NQZ68_013473 [Dissostichus eleginoides]